MIGDNKKYGFKSVILGAIAILAISLIGLTTAVTKADMEVDTKVGDNMITEVVIYNSHKDEEYINGYNVVEAGKDLAELLEGEGIGVQYLENDKDVEYSKAYEESRRLIQENVKDYDKTVLVDIHRTTDNEGIIFEMAKDSKNYTKNLEIAQILVNKLSRNGVKSSIYEYEKGILSFNLDLSEKALIVELGDENMSKDDVFKLIEELAKALK